MNEIKNYGIDIAREISEQSTKDWKFGATSLPCIAQIPATIREIYLPKGETQFGKEDFMDCATRGPLNLLETKLNWLLKNKKLPDEAWFRDNGYITENGIELSDRFIAIVSGTTRYGNSLKSPLDAIHKSGVIPKKLLPKQDWMTFDQYHDPKAITSEMFGFGTEFLKRITVNYEQVYLAQFASVDDMIDVAGFAWPNPINGVYPRLEGSPNHVWVNIRPAYFAFDNYLDTDGDYIKVLASDYQFFEYGYRLILSETPLSDSWKKKVFALLQAIGITLGLISKKVAELPKEPIKVPEEKPVIPEKPREEYPRYQWDTIEHIRKSIRIISDEEGLTLLQKNMACDVASCESQFNINCRGVVDKRDRGLFQWNSKWHPEITDEIAFNPEKNTRLACKAIKQGKAHAYWSASEPCWNKSGKYNSLL